VFVLRARRGDAELAAERAGEVTVRGEPHGEGEIFVRGAVAAELDCLAHRFARVSPAAARLHARMLGAHDPVAIRTGIGSTAWCQRAAVGSAADVMGLRILNRPV
jgi:hypothetical protein